MLLSNGVAVKAPRVLWSGTPGNWPANLDLGWTWASYSEMYRRQLWVYAVVRKLAVAAARLPVKVYQRGPDGSRVEARDHPLAQLLRRPNERMDPFLFWLWTSSTYDVFGETFWGKVRDAGGRPVALIPLHPTAMTDETDDSGVTTWCFETGRVRVENIPAADLVHFQTYNPDSLVRGMSPLEPLRSTLENEEAARRATSSFWRRGARPGVLLKHPGNLSKPAADRLKLQWNELAAGADNTGATVVLEEGMTPEKMELSAEEAQYIQSRKLNREEVCGAYDIPPPVVHILDRATFSNITEQMRSMYRDTMAPRLGYFEAVIAHQLRDSTRPGATGPDFGDDVYAEFLLDEVLRGDFETRVAAWATAIQTGQATAAEARTAENRPFIEGSDQLLINAALTPVVAEDTDTGGIPVTDLIDSATALIRAGFEPEASLQAVGLPTVPHTGLRPITVTEPDPLPAPVARSVLGRLAWQKRLADVDPAALTAGLNGHTDQVLAALHAAKAAGESVAELRERIKAL